MQKPIEVSMNVAGIYICMYIVEQYGLTKESLVTCLLIMSDPNGQKGNATEEQKRTFLSLSAAIAFLFEVDYKTVLDMQASAVQKANQIVESYALAHPIEPSNVRKVTQEALSQKLSSMSPDEMLEKIKSIR